MFDYEQCSCENNKHLASSNSLLHKVIVSKVVILFAVLEIIFFFITIHSRLRQPCIIRFKALNWSMDESIEQERYRCILLD